MNTTSKRARGIYVFILLFIIGVGYMCVNLFINSGTWVTNSRNRHLYSQGALQVGGKIVDANGVSLIDGSEGTSVYNEDEGIRKATLHVLGDQYGFISTGVQNVYDKELIGYDFFNGIYSFGSKSGNNINLTIDSEVSKVALKALGDKKGAVVVYNYETGEILCMVSTPTYDPLNKPLDITTDDTGKYEGIYLNRCLSASYTPGSTFKLVTAAAALENINGIEDMHFNCTGSYNCGDGTVICNGVHGDVTFKEALSNSCNSAFAQISNILGDEKLQEQAEKMGFNQKQVVDGVTLARSVINLNNISNVNLGWAGIGQYTLLANPTQMMSVCGAIANGGEGVEPYFVSSIRNSIELPVYSATTKSTKMISTSVADELVDMMKFNVKNKYGADSFPGLEIGAKTGTAQVDNKDATSWIVGFVKDKKTPVAFAVAVEEGGYGMTSAGPIANKVLQAIYD